jgi:signal transduction histidine kinase
LTQLSLDELLLEAEKAMSPLFSAKKISFRAAPGSGLRVRGDRDRVRQILLNLLSNAVKYTDSGGEVVMSTGSDGECVRIRVRDTGWGIPKEMQDAIFDPFVQLGRGPDGAMSDGVGLGLAISRELARAMSGDLSVESEVGVGSTFTLTLESAIMRAA